MSSSCCPLKEGDDGELYRYIVQWAENFPSDEEPPEEALGQTEEEVITLITCGGEWNIGRADYDHRTLVRAIRDTEASAGTPVATPRHLTSMYQRDTPPDENPSGGVSHLVSHAGPA